MKSVSVTLSHAQITLMLWAIEGRAMAPEAKADVVLLLSALAWQTLDHAEAPTQAPSAGPVTLEEAVSKVRAYLATESWADTYASGGRKGGATKNEIVAATGLSPDDAGAALRLLTSDLKSGGEKAGKWYRLR